MKKKKIMKKQSFLEKWDKVIKKMPLGKEKIKSNWEKEFEDEMVDSYEFGLDLREEDLLNLVEKYLDKNFSNPDNPNMKRIKVKIKCKNGCIQIERIGQ